MTQIYDVRCCNTKYRQEEHQSSDLRLPNQIQIQEQIEFNLCMRLKEGSLLLEHVHHVQNTPLIAAEEAIDEAM